MSHEHILDVRNVSLSFGGTNALLDVSFGVRRGEIRAIIGPNGAGKTSMLNCISGFYRPQKGMVLFKGTDLVQTQPTKSLAWALPAPSRISPSTPASAPSTT
jgi:branched-chain amino acid transport system ATP-binding protein